MTRVTIPWETSDSARSVREWELDLEASALLLMDFQIAYADPEAGMGPALAQRYPAVHEAYYQRVWSEVVPNAKRLLTSFHEQGLPVIFTRLGTYLTGGRDLPAWSWRRGAVSGAHTSAVPSLYPIGTREHALITDLDVHEADLVLDRPTLSIFNSTALHQTLLNLNVRNLVLCGMLAEGAPETTARAAGERGYSVLFVKDAVSALDDTVYQELLRALAWSVPRSTDEVLDLIRVREAVT
jgi:nicotinamidase-related amidase